MESEVVKAVLTLVAYAALVHVASSIADWVWWRYVDWYLDAGPETRRAEKSPTGFAGVPGAAPAYRGESGVRTP
jgi:hypothetical protein